VRIPFRTFAFCLAVSVLLSLGSGCRPAAEKSTPVADESADEGVFAELGDESGFDFVQFNGMSGNYYMAEITGSGGAFLDYDDDGDLDVYMVQGNMLGPGVNLDDALFPSRYAPPLRDRLYRNDLYLDSDGAARLVFVDVTEAVRLPATGYGMGVAVGDYNRDGWLDVYVTNIGPNHLLHNNGDGTFTDVGQEAGVADADWSVPAAFLDYDRDGWLDLFVGNYVDFPYERVPICRDFTGAQDYCGPTSFEPQADRLFRNLGNGSFEDASQAAGLQGGFGPALGVVTADFNGDRLTDIYVANDQMANNLWLNQGDGTFLDDALLAGGALNMDGKAEASMGVDAADFDRDGDLDLFMTHLVTETNTLYRNDGFGSFTDVTMGSGLGPASRVYTSFGTGWLDYDNDGWLDLVVVNGAVRKIESLARQGDVFPLHQPNQLFRNLGGGSFEETTDRAGNSFSRSEVSRGAVLGDLDNDGDTDLVVANNNGPARLLLNQVGNRARWIALHLDDGVSGDPPRQALAAVIRDSVPSGWMRVRIEGSYCSSNDSRILFGLDEGAGVEGVHVDWGDGVAQRWRGLSANHYYRLLASHPRIEGDK
jgi:hypothetical protein